MKVITFTERTGNIESTCTKVIQSDDEFITGMARPYRYAKDIEHNITEYDRAAAWAELHAQQQMFKDENNFNNYK